MPITPRNIKKPRLNFIRELVKASQFTDGGGASGSYQMGDAVPLGAVLQRTFVRVLVAFSGDTTATLIVGDGSDTDRYNTGTPSVFTTGQKDMGAPSGTLQLAADNRPTLTIAGGSDWGLVNSAGLVEVIVTFLEAF